MTESEKARRWRENHRLTATKLAEMTGYSRETIYWMERGETPGPDGARKPIQPWVWARYRNVCAGIDAQIRSGTNFEWGTE